MSALPSLNEQLVAGWSTQPVASSSTPKSNGVKTGTTRRLKRSANLNAASSGTAPSSERSTPQPAEGTVAAAAAGGSSTERATPRVRKRPRGTDGSGNDVSAKYTPPELKLSLLGGLQPQITQLMEVVVLPLLHPEIYQFTGVPRPRGVLLHGVPGGGKTRLVNCLAGELGFPFLSVSAPSIVSGMSGESEKTLRETFDEAKVGQDLM